jgi:hypothetical protein
MRLARLGLVGLASLAFTAQPARTQEEPEGNAASAGIAGTLEIEYRLNAVEGDLQPSYQTTAWLQDAEGRRVRSLLVSEWLAYAGHQTATICPTWHELADWENVSEEVFDSVTRATPDVASNILKVDLEPLDLPPGRYTYGVETHIVEEYNIAFTGEIELGGEASKDVAEKKPIPGAYPGGEGVLAEVKARYLP